jgi:hypothetical protein
MLLLAVPEALRLQLETAAARGEILRCAAAAALMVPVVMCFCQAAAVWVAAVARLR